MQFSILLCNRDRYPPFRPDVETLFGKEIAGRNHRLIWLLQSSEASHFQKVQTENITTYVGKRIAGDGGLSRAANAVLMVVNELRLPWVLWRERPSIVQVKDRFFAGVIGLLSARLFRVPFCFWLSYPYHEEYRERAQVASGKKRIFLLMRGIYTERLLRFLVRKSDHVFAQSSKMAEMLVTLGANRSRTSAVPMCIDVAAVLEIVKEPCILDLDQLCYLGTLSRVRKLDVLLDALHIVQQTMPRMRLVFVGKGELPGDKQFLLSRAKELGVEGSVRFTGQLPRAEGWRIVRQSFIGLSPFLPTPVLDVASPTKAVEYLALERPVIGTDSADQGELIRKVDGGELVSATPDEWAEAIIRLRSDPDKALTSARRASTEIIAMRSYSSMADQIEVIYKALVREAK